MQGKNTPIQGAMKDQSLSFSLQRITEFFVLRKENELSVFLIKGYREGILLSEELRLGTFMLVRSFKCYPKKGS